MLIDLTYVLSSDGNTIEETVPLEMTHFWLTKREHYKLIEKSPVALTVRHDRDQVIEISGSCQAAFSVPCARCLKPVRTAFDLTFVHRVDVLHPEADEDELETGLCIRDGKQLDVEQLVHNEILINWPLRVLCSENCLGICPTCGKDRNLGECTCNQESLDPRMAAFSELFSKFKEV